MKLFAPPTVAALASAAYVAPIVPAQAQQRGEVLQAIEQCIKDHEKARKTNRRMEADPNLVRLGCAEKQLDTLMKEIEAAVANPKVFFRSRREIEATVAALKVAIAAYKEAADEALMAAETELIIEEQHRDYYGR